MSDVTIKYSGSSIATMDASGSKTLGTSGKYCEGDIVVEYVKPSGGGGYTDLEVLTGEKPTGAVSFISNEDISIASIAGRKNMTSLIVDLTGGYILKSYAIRDNTALTQVAILAPSSYVNTNYGDYCMTGNTALKNIIIRGQIAGVNQSGFRSNSNLEIFDLEFSNSALGNNCFYGSGSKLKTVILRQNSVVPINSSTFTNTALAGANGAKVYVPNTLISSYQTASNWSTLYNSGYITFESLENSIYSSKDWWQ